MAVVIRIRWSGLSRLYYFCSLADLKVEWLIAKLVIKSWTSNFLLNLACRPDSEHSLTLSTFWRNSFFIRLQKRIYLRKLLAYSEEVVTELKSELTSALKSVTVNLKLWAIKTI